MAEPRNPPECIVCEEPVEEDDDAEVYSCFCGSIHPECKAEHARECGVCRDEFLKHGDISEEDPSGQEDDEE